MHPKVIVIVPTYNEAENIGRLLDELLAINPNLEILVVDDDSPDGTWRIVQDRATARIHLLHRKKDRGRGRAGIAGYRYALAHGADYIIEMDADFSHDPRFIPDLINAMVDADVVLGSRYVDNRGFLRRFVTKLAGLYIRSLLGIRVKDPTSGFRCFRSDILRRINLDTLKAGDPFIVTEVLYRCHKVGARIGEVPIVFKDREKGTSKLGIGILLLNLWKVLRLRWS